MLLKPGRGDLVGVVELDMGESLPINELDLVGELGDLLKPSLKGGTWWGRWAPLPPQVLFNFSNQSDHQDSSILNGHSEI